MVSKTNEVEALGFLDTKFHAKDNKSVMLLSNHLSKPFSVAEDVMKLAKQRKTLSESTNPIVLAEYSQVRRCAVLAAY